MVPTSSNSRSSSFPLSTSPSSILLPQTQPQPKHRTSSGALASQTKTAELPTLSTLRRFSAPPLTLARQSNSPPRPYGVPPSPLSPIQPGKSPQHNEKNSASSNLFISLPKITRLKSPPHPIQVVKAAFKAYHTSTSPTTPPPPHNAHKGPFRMQRHESRCIQIVAPGLYIAFEDDSRSFSSVLVTSVSKWPPSISESLLTKDGLPFTHVISLSHQPSVTGISERYSETSDNAGVKYLHLPLPPIPAFGYHKFEKALMKLGLTLTSDAECYPFLDYGRDKYIQEIDLVEEKGIPLLFPEHFRVAKDFIEKSGYDFRRRQSPLPVRVLITTPRDDRADAVGLVAVYLALAAELKVQEILQLMDEKDTFLSVWKGAIGKEWVSDLQQLVLHLGCDRML